MNCIVVRKVNGVDVTQFNPTPRMRLFALTALCDPAFAGKPPEQICSALGGGAFNFPQTRMFTII